MENIIALIKNSAKTEILNIDKLIKEQQDQIIHIQKQKHSKEEKIKELETIKQTQEKIIKEQQDRILQIQQQKTIQKERKQSQLENYMDLDARFITDQYLKKQNWKA